MTDLDQTFTRLIAASAELAEAQETVKDLTAEIESLVHHAQAQMEATLVRYGVEPASGPRRSGPVATFGFQPNDYVRTKDGIYGIVIGSATTWKIGSNEPARTVDVATQSRGWIRASIDGLTLIHRPEEKS